MQIDQQEGMNMNLLENIIEFIIYLARNSEETAFGVNSLQQKKQYAHVTININ